MLLRCLCCKGCVIFRDSFERPNNTDLGAPWHEGSGDFEVNGGTLALTSSGNKAYAYIRVTSLPTFLGAPQSHTLHSVTCRLKGTVSGDKIGVVFAGAGTTSGSVTPPSAAVVLTVHDSAAKIQLVGGPTAAVPTALTSEADCQAAVGEWHTLRVCTTPQFAFAFGIVKVGVTVFLNDALVLRLDARVWDSNYLSSGYFVIAGPFVESAAGVPRWDDFVVEHVPSTDGSLYSRCPACQTCESGTISDNFSTLHGAWQGRWNVAGGRLRAPAAAVYSDIYFRATRCVTLPENYESGLNLLVKVKSFWSPGGFGIGGFLMVRNQAPDVTFGGGGGAGNTAFIRAVEIGTFPGWFTSVSAFGSTYVAGAPVSGEEHGIRIQAVGGGLYDFDFLVDGVSIGSQGNVPFSFQRQAWISLAGISVDPDAFFQEFDDFSVTT